MNANEFNFAYKVRHALNENLDALPSSTIERLASARNLALSRKKKTSPLRKLATQGVLAGHVGGLFGAPAPWIRHLAVAIPMIVLVVGLVGIYQSEQQQRISETADIDAAVLSDELPLTAYLDHGFNAYLATRAD